MSTPTLPSQQWDTEWLEPVQALCMLLLSLCVPILVTEILNYLLGGKCIFTIKLH